jgi:rhamnose utilization protein RhaD (predicted bifunctional aldolase and dehydrogenase)
MDPLTGQLIELAATAGDDRRMAILGEGNVSGTAGAETFLVKASGTRLATLGTGDLVEVRFAPLLAAVEDDSPWPDEDVERLLLDARVDAAALKPSVESLFHAWLLRLPEVRFVGHAHPIAVNQLLCSPRAREYAERRLFPDQVVYCGPESVLVPYVDPGLQLARRIAAEVESFRVRTDRVPRTILIGNHGLIATGATHTEVAAALAMAEKSAAVFVGAVTAGGPVFMSGDQVRRITDRVDEHYRQRMLRGDPATAG